MKSEKEDICTVLEIAPHDARWQPREVGRSRCMVFMLRITYIAGVLIWVLYVALFPTWVGRLYNPENYFGNPGAWHEGGVFGLQGAPTPGFYGRAPIWSPPAAHGDGIQASIRWPWQPVSQRAHVEIALGRLLARCSAGIILLGILLRVANWINLLGKPDLTDSIAWSLSLALIIAWVTIGVLAVFSMGYAATDPVVTGVLSAGLVAGSAYGLVAYKIASVRIRSIAPVQHTPPNDSATERPNQAPAGQSRQVGAGLFWFTLGVVVALCITGTAGYVASHFRGPVVGVWELGTPRFAYDQRPIDLATGFGILASGWLLGGVLLRKRSARGFAIGVLVASTLLGLLFVMRT
jgi:hypothetical protein